MVNGELEETMDLPMVTQAETGIGRIGTRQWSLVLLKPQPLPVWASLISQQLPSCLPVGLEADRSGSWTCHDPTA